MKEIAKEYLEIINSIKKDVSEELLPPQEGYLSDKQLVISIVLVKNTRGYIEKISNQINGCYEKGWYDACAVMIRRLIETLIIEVFEKHNLSSSIKDSNGDYYFLRDLITLLLNDTSWSLGRNVKTALPHLKDIGDKSAHSRRYNAQRDDIDKIKSGLRDVVQELIYLSGLK